MDFKGSIGNRCKVPKFADQILDNDIHVPRAGQRFLIKGSTSLGKGKGIFFRFFQKDHEAIFQRGRNRLCLDPAFFEIRNTSHAFLEDKMNLPAAGHGIDHMVPVIDELGLQETGRLLFRGFKGIAAAPSNLRKTVWSPAKKKLSLVKDIDLLTQCRFIHISGTDKDG